MLRSIEFPMPSLEFSLKLANGKEIESEGKGNDKAPRLQVSETFSFADEQLSV